ncbi:MAG: sterol desaturase family protein, partial [Burkholderiales bacterium]|nr:sterol desaturase family protein [Burkholderiales bacterium]
MELGFDPGLILLAMAPVFIGCILWEAWYWHKRGVAKYSLVDTLSNTCLAALHQGADILATLLFIKTAYAWVYQHGIHVFVMNAWNVALAFLVQDFLYYWFHRAHHR